MKLDILAIAAHPDDVELGCSGTLIKQSQLGYSTGILDLTRGEMGTRGTPELRQEEAIAAGRIMGVKVRENLGFKDAHFVNDELHREKVTTIIRKYRPEVLIITAPSDRHPDHGKANALCTEACFLSGLRNISTTDNGKEQEPWRPKVVYSYIQGRFLNPDFIVDISDQWQSKMESILSYKSQFYDPKSKEPSTWLATPEFLSLIEGRAIEFGQAIGATYGEGFIVQRWLGVNDLMSLK